MDARRHTPGPWCYGDLDEQYVNVYDYGLNVFVAEVSEEDCPREVRNANAHLIAAAPELLQCLQDVVKAWLYEASQGDGIDFEHGPVLHAAQTAISKALNTLKE